jgi:hypothetical protein
MIETINLIALSIYAILIVVVAICITTVHGFDKYHRELIDIAIINFASIVSLIYCGIQ